MRRFNTLINTHCPASWSRIWASSWTRTLCAPRSSCTGPSGRWPCPLWWTRRWCHCTEPAIAPDCPFPTKWPSSCPAGRTGIWPCPDPRRARTRVWGDASDWTEIWQKYKRQIRDVIGCDKLWRRQLYIILVYNNILYSRRSRSPLDCARLCRKRISGYRRQSTGWLGCGFGNRNSVEVKNKN